MRSYLQIQKARYQDIMEYTLEIDPQLGDAMIPKLTLQPLVENALYHGIKLKRAKGTIRITGTRQGDDVILRVEDNGVGMSQERLEQLRQGMQSKKPLGFGMSAVNQRLQLQFGAQYGLTIGEAARYIRDYQKLTLDLTVIPLEGWERGMYLDDTDLPWVAPSPNCATLNAALCYIGTCVFEGTNLSEGRGTTLPFEVIGAPFIDNALLEKKMNGLGLPGVHFRRTSFCPTFSKHQGVLCHGVQMHVLDRQSYDSFTDGLLLLDTIRSLYPEEFQFVRWSEKSPYSIDLLLGTDEYRTGALTAQGLMDKYAPKVKEFVEAAKQYRLY